MTVKKYAVSGGVYDRIITNPAWGTITLISGGSIDYETGVITGDCIGRWRSAYTVDWEVREHDVSRDESRSDGRS